MKEAIQYVSSVMGVIVGYLLGGIDGFLYALITLMVLDYITGLMVAVNEKKLCSSIGFKGIMKKCTMLFMVVLGNMVDMNLLQDGNIARTAVIFFYLSNEGISLIENADVLGVPVPKKLITLLKQFEDESEFKN